MSDKKRAVVLFSGIWCPDCREFKPIWERWTATTRSGVYAIEVPRDGNEWKEWDLQEIPTVAAFELGREIARVHGTISASDLDAFIHRIDAH